MVSFHRRIWGVKGSAYREESARPLLTRVGVSSANMILYGARLLRRGGYTLTTHEKDTERVIGGPRQQFVGAGWCR